MKKLSIIFTGILIAATALFGMPVYAQTAEDSVCQGIGLTASSGDCSGDPDTPTVNSVIAAAVNILSIVAGVAGVIMVIVGGFKYITAGGDSNAVGSAKSTITYAIIGLVVAAFAQIIVRFVLTKAIRT